ncbi:MAG: T9SS type A sorting domain-containing protein [Flavobacteriaceae bacterium]|nr:T9SS type A sorting domain-containing protein [Flavobacteriaceae bacterium]
MKNKLFFLVFFLSSLFLTSQNLIAYYPFNGNANDESGNNHNGTVYGATLTSDKNGNSNSAYYFDGIDNYIDVGNWENGGPMTITFWARWDTANHNSRIIDFGNGEANDNITIGNNQSTGKVLFQIYNGATNKFLSTYYVEIDFGVWNSYVGRIDQNGIMNIFKNGTRITERQQANIPNIITRTKQYIGKSNTSYDQFFKGAIDEIRIYNVALTDAQISTLYTNETLAVKSEKIAPNLKFYVNNNTLNFKNTQNLSDIKNIAVFNMLGQKVYQTDIITNKILFNSLKTGVYILKIENKNSKDNTLKFIIY